MEGTANYSEDDSTGQTGSSGSDDEETGSSGSDDEEEEEEEDEDEEDVFEEEEAADDEGNEEQQPPPLPPKRPRHETLDDRISALPDAVLLHILSFLSMKNVVKTGILSKRWQFLWTSVSTLVFHDQDFKETRRFSDFISRTLVLSRCSAIKKFMLIFDYEHCFASDVCLWIRFATQNNVEDLELGLTAYRLPQHLFTNSSLKKLSLTRCKIWPNGVVNWRSLRSLAINFVELSDYLMEKILSGSPQLEFLELSECWGTNRVDISSSSLKHLVIRNFRESGQGSVLEISAPNLESLDILGYFYETKFRLINVASLVSASLEFCSHTHADCGVQRDIVRELFDRLKHVQELRLGGWFIKVLSVLEVNGLASPCSSLKCLTLDECIKEWHIPGIARLLRSSLNLETLVINMASNHLVIPYRYGSINVPNFDRENYWMSEKRIFKCLLLHLKTVKIIRFTGDLYGFGLVQFLLKDALVLEKMIIDMGGLSWNKCSTCSMVQQHLQVTQKLLSFPRSSPHAVISFCG